METGPTVVDITYDFWEMNHLRCRDGDNLAIRRLPVPLNRSSPATHTHSSLLSAQGQQTPRVVLMKKKINTSRHSCIVVVIKDVLLQVYQNLKRVS